MDSTRNLSDGLGLRPWSQSSAWKSRGAWKPSLLQNVRAYTKRSVLVDPDGDQDLRVGSQEPYE